MRQLVLGFFLFLTATGTAWANYHIELIVFRQAGVEPVIHSRTAPDNWLNQASELQPEQFRSSLLNSVVSKLIPANGYKILLQRAWQQESTGTFQHIGLSSGEQRFGHHPVEGVFSIRQDRANEVVLDFWVNQFETDGNIAASEHLKQSAVIPYRELSYIDHGSLGVLIRVLPQ